MTTEVTQTQPSTDIRDVECCGAGRSGVTHRKRR